MRRLRIWFRANFLDYRYWRVQYKDGVKTIKLHYAEAKGLAEVFNGKLYIDYTVNLD